MTMKRNLFYALAALTVLSFGFTGCNENTPRDGDIAVTSVTLLPETLTLVVGGTGDIVLTVLPDNATDRTVEWTSDDLDVATVADGVVTAVAPGRATVTATANDGSGKFDECVVTVHEGVVPVTAVELDKERLELVEGDEETLTATVTPDNATDGTVSWSSGNDNVATVDGEGHVVATGVGETTITVTANDGSGKFDECIVIVEAAFVPVTAVELNKNTLELSEGNDETLTANVTPDNATDRTVSWSSDNEAVATVDQNGKVFAEGPGQATVTATANDGSGLFDECIVIVEAAITAPPRAKTNRTWLIGDQIWSDAIDFCNKDEELLDEYNGGTYGSAIADCRANPEPEYGHLYSWPYVQNNAADLCPDGWRVPSQDDFIALDIELGGTGLDNQSNAPHAPEYLGRWGGQYGGYVYADATGWFHYEDGQGTMAYYWSTTSLSAGAGGSLNVIDNGFVDPRKRSGKEQAYMVRCVQDNSGE